MKNLRGDLRTIVLALAAGLIGANAPAIAHGVNHALFAHNSDKVDGLNAVKAGAANKNTKLVATSSSGKLPVSVIPKADANTLDGQDSSEFLAIDAKAADSDLLDGQDSNTFAATSHNHDGAAITTGTVAEPRVASALARDSEIMSIILGADGPTSGLDADLLDGQTSAAFAASSHTHDGAAIISGTVADARIASTIARDAEIMPVVLAADGPGSTLDADLLDGKQLTDIETTTREVNQSTGAVDLDAATAPVLCQSAAYVADLGDRARVSVSASLANQGGATNMSFTLDPVFSTNGGTVWSSMSGGFLARETADINGWGNGTVFGDAALSVGVSYIFGVQVARDGLFGGSVDPGATRCHLLAEIDEDL